MATKDSNEDESKKDNSEDNFGLPDIEYKPLDQSGESAPIKEEVTSSSESTYKSSYTDSSDPIDGEPKSKAPVIIGIVIVLVLVVAGYLIYNFVIKPGQLADAEKARKEQLAKDELKKKQQEEARLAQEREAERIRLEALANAKPAIGTIETLSARTKRYYVVVTSDIDDDLLMDYAKKLSAKGVSTKIIPPFGTKNFFRLAIADHETFALAQTNADAAKADYGGGVWVIKY
jgi:ribosomal protein L9